MENRRWFRFRSWSWFRRDPEGAAEASWTTRTISHCLQVLQVHGANGQVFDEREWLDPQGRLKKQVVRAAYTDFKGGQIDSEKLITSAPKQEADGSISVSQAEEPGSKIDWLFTIKQTKQEAVGQDSRSTYQVVNDGTPANAAFEITSWDLDDKKESGGKEYTVTFPKPGDYVVKAHGKTGKYGSEFTIPLPVHF